MNHHADQLDYEPRPRPTRRLIFEADADGCSLTFPRKAAWLIWGDIAFDLGCMTISVIWLGGVIGLSHRSAMPIPIPAWMIVAIVAIACLAALSSLKALRSHLKRGHLACCIHINRLTQTLSLRDERSNRWRDWPLAAVRTVQLKPVTSMIPGQKAAELVIRTEKRRPSLRYRCRNEEVQVAEQFISWLNESRR